MKWAGDCVAWSVHVSVSDMLPPTASPARTALPAAHFRSQQKHMPVRGQDTKPKRIITPTPSFRWRRSSAALPPSAFCCVITDFGWPLEQLRVDCGVNTGRK